jgi:hypothetical protein
MSFYSGAVEDFSLLLMLWVRSSRRAKHRTVQPRVMETGSGAHGQLERRIRGWVHGKTFRTRMLLARHASPSARTAEGPDILISPSGVESAPRSALAPFHLYHLEEFSEDVQDAGGEVQLWRCNAELNGDIVLPPLLRRMDHLHFCAVVPAIVGR